MLERMLIHHGWVCKLAHAVEISMAVPHEQPISSSAILRHILKGSFVLPQRLFLNHVQCFCSHNNQKLGKTWMSLSRCTDKERVVYLHNGVLLKC